MSSDLSSQQLSAVRRHIVWVCAGCDDCEPLDGSAPSRFPCRNSPSSNGAEVVLAEDYDRMCEGGKQLDGVIRRLSNENERLRAAIEDYLLWEPGRAGHAAASRKLKDALGTA